MKENATVQHCLAFETLLTKICRVAPKTHKNDRVDQQGIDQFPVLLRNKK